MGLSQGSKLGVYEVVGAIGAGGMGEVYRARDTRLNRDVALKVLPDLFARDPDRLARFEREAHVLASLNHPNIAAIYELEESGGMTALVMELVEGDTLDERIRRPEGLRLPGDGSGRPSGLPIDEALAIARQIAEALAVAHEHGIIHRDLKPANIKVRSDGTVKVLDFGLAKALAPAGDLPADVTASPTITSPAQMTGAGVILGTAAYMAPEQAKGREADRRSDLWAFGCVLYEMLTGRRPFEGEDVADTLAAVFRADPDWTALPAEVPASIRTLLRRCLAKDRRMRVAEAATCCYVLDEARQAGPSGEDQARVHAQIEQAVASTRRELAQSTRRRVALVGMVAVVATGIIIGATMWIVTRPAPPRTTRLTIATAGPLALSFQGIDRDVAVTPDGSKIVYRGNGQIFVRALDTLEPTALTGLGGPRGLFVSPDGQWIGFSDGNSLLKKVAITGGPAVTVTPVDGNGPRGASWNEDGTIVFATVSPASGLQLVSAAGGNVTVLTKPDREHGEADHLWPEFLPGGRAVLFTITPASGGIDNSQIAVLDLQTREQKILLRGGSHAHYVRSGHLVYGVGGTLRAVAFDLGRLAVIGTPVPVLEGVTMGANGALDADVAADGTLVYLPGQAVAGAQRTLVWVDRQGHEEPLSAPPRAYMYPRLSPDNARMALYSNDQEQDLWMWDVARRTLTRLTFEPGQDLNPSWTGDGRSLVFASERDGGVLNLWMQAADGTGSATRLTKSNNTHNVTALSPDGTQIVFNELTPDRLRDLRLLTLAPSRTNTAPRGAAGASSAANASASEHINEGDVRTLLDTRFEERGGAVSPDGHWLAYESNSSSRFEIYVRPFPNVGDGQWQVSTGGGVQALWARDGRELFYFGLDGALMVVPVSPTGAAWSAGNATKLLEGRYFTAIGTGANPSRHYDVSADGKRFLMIKEATGDQTTTAQNLIVVENWDQELKRLVPLK